MHSSKILRWMMAALLLTVSGCIAFDPKISRQHPASEDSTRLHGQFSCRPSYRSDKLMGIGPPSLGLVFSNSDCLMATLDYSEDFGLMVSLEHMVSLTEHRSAFDELMAFDRHSGLSSTTEGKIILGRKLGCGAAGGAVFCGKSSTTLFLNADGDLVVIEDGDGVGLALQLPVPLAFAGRLMAIFPHWEG